MIIDMHTHIFPEKIVKRTIAHLAEVAGIQAYTDGTLDGLRRSMQESGIDYSLVLPVVTKPQQFQTVNDYAAEINGTESVLSFGGIHPDTLHCEEELDYILSLGLKGIKLHPDYQKVMVDDERNLRIIRGAIERGLWVTLHAGIDVGLPEPVHCPPERSAKMLDQMEQTFPGMELPIILAHNGGYGCQDAVEEHLIGRNVYLDLSFTLGKVPEEQLLRMIRNHGADRVLFATDSPWGGQKEMLSIFQKLSLSNEEKNAILSENARRILNF